MDEASRPRRGRMKAQTDPAPTLHPDVHAKIRECDIIYLEANGVEDRHLKACWKLLSMGHSLTPEKLDDLCISYCKRWTQPF
jgi:hypothetical protein